MFEHSVRVPRHYKVAANIYKKVSTEGGSVKSLLYDQKLRHFRTNVLFALITETIKHAADIDKMFESCGVLQNEPRLDPWLAKVLTAELLYGKKALPSKSKPEQTVLNYKEKFEKYQSEHQDDLTPEVTPKPRYIRVNTNLLTTSDAIRAFEDEGYRFVRCTSGSYEDYLEQIQNLTEYVFTQDYHVKTVFVFAPGTKMHDHELYLNNHIILQNKATAMAVHLLAPPAGSVVLDMCAAPGMKTTQLAAYLRNNGKIYAVERNEKRFETLREFVSKTGSQCVQAIHRDCLDIKRGEYDDVEYILLDPSCSGSGMDFSVHNYIEETRLAKLTSLQEKFLKHAMNAFPKAKRIVYSTCSLFPEENERVITNVVKTSRAKWRVQDVKELLKGQWKNFGSGMYGSMGTRCMYSRAESDFTTGFFLAVLDRDPKDLEKSLSNENSVAKNGEKSKDKISKKKQDTIKDLSGCKKSKSESVKEIYTEEFPKKEKKKHKINDDDNNTTESVVDGSIDVVDKTELERPKKKKKKVYENKGNLSELTNNFDSLVVNNTNVENVTKTKGKANIDHNDEVSNDLEDISNIVKEHNEKAKKKKRKKDHDFPYDMQASPDSSETVVKRKKIKTNLQNVIELPPDVVTNSAINEPHTKKKKKKRNENSMEMC